MGIRFGVFLTLIYLGSFAHGQGWKNGDLIFQKSMSAQSGAIQEATGSEWTHVGILRRNDQGGWDVLESRGQSVVATDLAQFASKGRNQEFVVKRWRSLDVSHPKHWNKVLAEIQKMVGRPYDIFFEWSDESIYCSELVFKSYLRAFGQSPGKVQRFGDLNLKGPKVNRLIQERLNRSGKRLSLDEKIVTPASLFVSEDLSTVSP